ncbi:Alpha/Beta hydrolase protein [Gigaspora rosea]|uniref:Alpha/Beta hydrolase protein n=1 Tax=Gigaspora rosea TaxID=44941 RepID=A0A397V1K3_9GLOM|nr:Alpha/Beta hydrolase protein [Gigaspora rosea]
MVFGIIYYASVLLVAGLTYASVEGKLPKVPQLQRLTVIGFSLISEWPLPVIAFKIVLIVIASALGVFRGFIPQIFYIIDLLSMVGLVVLFIDAYEARRNIEIAIQSYSDHQELPTFTSETFWQRMVNPRFIPENVVHYADISYIRNAESIEAKKDGFEQTNELTLDVFALKPSNLKPVLLFIPGGGWIGKGAVYPLIRHLAERGWVVVSMNYRPQYPARLIDAKRALRWIKTNIKYFGGDPDFVVVGGDGIVGQTAATVALTPNVQEFQVGFEDLDTSVKACLLINAVTDISDSHFDSPTTDETFLSKHSPIRLLREDTVPFLVFHGDRDDFIPVEATNRFVEEFKKKSKSEIQFIAISGGHHIYHHFSSPRSHYQAIGAEIWLNHIYHDDKAKNHD